MFLMEIFNYFHLPTLQSTNISREAEMDAKVGHMFVSVCVGYITMLIITAAILWYVIHVYQRSYAHAIADELYRKTFSLVVSVLRY